MPGTVGKNGRRSFGVASKPNMTEEEKKWEKSTIKDPHDLLPFTKELEPHDEEAQVIPKVFQGSLK